MAVDLCTVNLDGETTISRPDVDGGEGVALSPDRTAAAFIEDGALNLIDIDGENEVVTRVEGRSPEWLNDHAVGLVTPDGRGLVSVDTTTFAAETLMDASVLPDEMQGAVIESFAVAYDGERIVAALYDDVDPPGDDDRDRFGLGDLDLRNGLMSLRLGPSTGSIGHPDWSPDGRLLVTIDLDLHLVDLATGQTTLVSPPQFHGTSPTWSADGSRIAWLANGVGGPEGPAVLAYLDVADLPDADPTPIVGNRGAPLDRLPAFPDW